MHDLHILYPYPNHGVGSLSVTNSTFIALAPSVPRNPPLSTTSQTVPVRALTCASAQERQVMTGVQHRPADSPPRDGPLDDEPPSSRIPLRGYVMAVGMLVSGIFGGFSLGAESIPPASAPGSPGSQERPTTLTVPGDGTFWVGSDVKPGLYRSLANGDRCTWTRARDATGEPGSVLGHKSSTGNAYVYLVRGDFFDTRGCRTWRRRVGADLRNSAD